MPDGSLGIEYVSARTGVPAVLVPSEGTSNLRVVLDGNLAHKVDGQRPEYSVTAVHYCCADHAQVFSVREDAGISGIAAVDPPGNRVVYGSHQWQAVSLNLCRCAKLLQGCIVNTFQLFQGGVNGEVAGVPQLERREHVLLRIFIKLLAGDPFKDPLQGDEIQAAVETFGAGSEIPLDTGSNEGLKLVRSVLPELGHIAVHGDVGVKP